MPFLECNETVVVVVVVVVVARPKSFPPSNRIALIYQSFCSRTIADGFQHDGMSEKNLDGWLS